MPGNSVRYGTDHPAAGPTGPIAAGACFPTTRTPSSFFFGTVSAPFCPGDPLFDSIANAEWLMSVSIKGTTSVENANWGAIKAMYR